MAYAHDGSTSIRIDQIKTQDFSYGSNKVAKHNLEMQKKARKTPAKGGTKEVHKKTGKQAHKRARPKKGSKVVVTGRGNLRTYQGQDGQNKSSLDLVVSDFTLPDRQTKQIEEF